jgi:SAM-dependent methyltransferase
MPIEEDGYSSIELPSFDQAPNYYAAILAYFALYLGGLVVEVGAGIGTFPQCLLSFPQITTLTLVEPARNLVPILREKFFGNSNVRLMNGNLQSVAGSLSCDAVVLMNVLTHVEHDEGLLRAIHQVLKPGGTVLLFVPALPSLYEALDEAFGHIRRYRKSELDSLLAKVGFQVGCLRYFNLPGIVSWFLFGKIFKRTTLSPWNVWLYDRLFMSWIPGFERRWEPVFGQSVLAVCTKPSKGNRSNW